MRRHEVLGISLIAVAISGCAGPRTAQTINRLQATMDLLDRRITQLERVSTREVTEQPLDSQSSDAVATATSPPTLPSAERGTATPVRSWAKPSTKEIQQALKNAGFYQGSIDGKMGPLTREALREFQRVHGLTVDGIVGKKTWAQLAPYQDLSASSGELVAAETLK